MRRPILFPAFFYCVGIILSYQINYLGSDMWRCVFVVFTAILIITLMKKYLAVELKSLLALILCLLIGYGNFYFNLEYKDCDYSKYMDKSHQFAVKVENVVNSDDEKISVDCICEKIDDVENDENVKIRAIIYKSKLDKRDFFGSEIILNGKLARPKRNTNPHCFNYDLYLKGLGINYTLSANGCTIVNRGDGYKECLLQKREEYLDYIKELCGIEDSSADEMIRGMVFGDKSELDESVYEAFQKNGTAHILAVSGLHVGMIFAGLRKLLKKRNRKLYYISTFVVLLGYGIVTQWSISVIRAIIMIVIFLVGEIIHRRYDMLSAAFATALILLAINPMQIFSCGFQMSFLAVMGISILNKKISRKLPSYIALMISIQLVLMPYIAYQFNYISLASFIINFPTTLIAGIVVPVILIFFCIYSVLGIKLVLLHKALFWLVDILVGLNGYTNSTGIGSFEIESPVLFAVIALITIVLYAFSEHFEILYLRKEYEKMLVCAGIIVSMSFIISYQIDDKFDCADIIFVDVGQGDCVNLRCDGGNYIFDSGEQSGKKMLKPYLFKNSQDVLNGAFITHNHNDHFLAAKELSEIYNIDAFYFSKNYEAIKNELQKEAKANKYFYLGNTSAVNLDEQTKIEILWPREDMTEIDVTDENKNSLVMKIVRNGVSILVTGDIDSECEKEMLEYYQGTDALRADILKVAHHGSRYSSCDEFIEAVSPQTAVIQVGKNNYGHPTSEVLDRLKAHDVKIYRNDEEGAVGVKTEEDGGYEIFTMNEGI